MKQYKEQVATMSVDELLDKEMELDNIDIGVVDDDVLADIAEYRLAIEQELNSRGVFDARDYEEYDPWQGYEEPEDFPEEDPEEDIKPVVADYTSSELLETDGKRFMRRLSMYTYDGLNVQLGKRLYVHCEYDGGMGLTATLCDPALPTNYGKFGFRDFESFAEYLKLAEDYKELDDESLIDIVTDMDYYINEGVLIFAPDEYMDELGSKFCLAEGFLNDRLD